MKKSEKIPTAHAQLRAATALWAAQARLISVKPASEDCGRNTYTARTVVTLF